MSINFKISHIFYLSNYLFFLQKSVFITKIQNNIVEELQKALAFLNLAEVFEIFIEDLFKYYRYLNH